MKPAALLTSIFLFVITIVHLVRVAVGVRVTVGDYVVPMWASVVAAVIVGGLGIWLWREQSGGGAHS